MLRSLLGLILFLFANLALASSTPTVIAGKPHSPQDAQWIEVYAHRGARSIAPENTLPSYKAGLAAGTQWVDMDIGISKDGTIVVYHDFWLNPDVVSDPNGKFWASSKEAFVNNIPAEQFDTVIEPYLVNKLNFAELSQYEVGMLNPASPYSRLFPEQKPILGTRIPQLQEVVDYANQITHHTIHFQIEIKNDPTHPHWTVPTRVFAEKLNAFLEKNNIVDKTEIQAFDWQVLYDLQKINPNIKTAYLVAERSKALMQSPDPKLAGLLTGGKLLKDYDNSLPKMIKALGGSCYEPEDIMLTQQEVEEAHRLGLKVVAWTWPENSGKAFDPMLVHRVIDWGVDGIITDDPRQLNALLASRGLYVPPGF